MCVGVILFLGLVAPVVFSEIEDYPSESKSGFIFPRRRAKPAPAPVPAGMLAVVVRVERYGSRATVSFESLHIRIPLKFCQNSAKLSQFFRNYDKI